MLPYLQEVQNPSKKYSVVFRGLNYGEGTQDGEFAETHNLSTDQYPCITQRAERVKVRDYVEHPVYPSYNPLSPTSLHSKGEVVVCCTNTVPAGALPSGTVFYGDTRFSNFMVGHGLRKNVRGGKKQMATVGNYVVIFPDKAYIKVPTKEGEKVEYGGLEWKYYGKGLKFTSSTITLSKEAVEEGHSFKGSKVYANDTDLQGGFKEGDAVTITGCSKSENNKTTEIIIRAVTDDTLTFDDNAFTAVESEANEVTISRTVPDLDFICESNYRLWGTKGNTIYSSKFSDPFNFQVFDGLASDSYAIEVGSEGEFTGCIPYSSHICFFKENTLHKLYGTKPSNFQITTANVYGVQSGSEGSMQIVNEQLLYKGVGGVYAYTGGVPELISEKFGNKRYSEATACCDGEKYYISMKQGDTWNMFTYDVAKNIWLREDDTHAVDMTFYDGKVYYLDATGGLYYIDKTADRSNIEWGATFCTMHETMNERKGYSKFHLRMDLSAGAWLAVDIKTDNDLQWRQVYTTHNEKAKTVSIPIMPTRCDSIDIRLRGKGKCTIKAFIREFTVGSDV